MNKGMWAPQPEKGKKMESLLEPRENQSSVRLTVDFWTPELQEKFALF